MSKVAVARMKDEEMSGPAMTMALGRGSRNALIAVGPAFN